MRILVTRPEPGASETAARLGALGHDAVVLPLTRIEPLDVRGPVGCEFDAVVVTSANAVRHTPEGLLRSVCHLPCVAVGTRTAQNARDAGFDRVECADGDAVSLARLIGARLPRGSRLLYLCGRVRRTTFEPALVEMAMDVSAIETYDTLPVDYSPAEIRDRLGSEPIHIAMIYSAEAAEAFLRLAASLPPLALAGRSRMLCISQRVADILAAAGFDVDAAPEPSEPSMLSTLRAMPALGHDPAHF